MGVGQRGGTVGNFIRGVQEVKGWITGRETSEHKTGRQAGTNHVDSRSNERERSANTLSLAFWRNSKEAKWLELNDLGQRG